MAATCRADPGRGRKASASGCASAYDHEALPGIVMALILGAYSPPMLRRAPCEVRIPDVPATLGPLECGLSTDSILHYLFVFDQKLLKKIEIIRTFLTFFAVFQFFWSKTGSCLPIYWENKIKKSGMEPVALFVPGIGLAFIPGG